MDSCSQGPFTLDKLARAVGNNQDHKCRTHHTNSSVTTEDLQIANINNVEGEWIDLPKTYTKPDLPVDNADITLPSQLKQWKYLDHITHQLNLEDNVSIGLLIGANCVKALQSLEILQSRNEGPYAFKTRLGWCIIGQVSNSSSSAIRT